MKTKISILIYSLASGGAERQVSILLESLQDKYDLTLVLMNDTIFYTIPKDVKVVYLEKSKPFENGFKKLLKLPYLGWKYKKLLQNSKIDISLSFMTRPNYINVFSKLFSSNVRTIISERSQFSMQYSYGNLQSYINKKLVKLYNYADLVVANSKGNAQDLKLNFNIETKIKMIYNAINIKKIDSLKSKTMELEAKKFVFVTVGRLDEGKNHQIIIDAMKSVDAILWIIGDGELKNNLELIIDNLKLKDRVKLLGRQKNPYKFLSKADCFVFASNHEGFPNVLLEALACGLPIISTDCKSGPREMLSPNSDIRIQLQNDIELAKYGILTPINSTLKLKEAMKLIINDNELRTKYKKQSKQRAEDFKIEKIIKQYEKILCVERN